MPIVLINEKRQCVDMLREVIYTFPAQTKDELYCYFPFFAESLVDNSLKILMNIKEVITIECEGLTLYVPQSISPIPYEYYNNRMKIKPALDFLRLMFNSTDEDGYLVNDIPYFAAGDFPCSLYFRCNSILYEVYLITENNIDICVNLIRTKDENAVSSIKSSNPRVVITDIGSGFDKLLITNLKYIACQQKDGSFELHEVQEDVYG